MSSPVRVRSARAFRATASLGLALLLAIGGTAGTYTAVPNAAPPYAPLHTFGWPASGVPNDALFSYQTDLAPIDTAAAWRQTTGSASVVVAVLDSGLDASSAEFAGRIVPGYNAITGVADGGADLAATFDDSGHGTHVSGTIAAAANNAAGIAGIAPDTSIMPVKVVDAKGSGDFATMSEGLNWAVAHGARIVTLSLGGDLPADLVPVYAAPFAAAYEAGVVVIAAAGNDGTTATQYPCNFPHVVCVGSTTNDGTSVSTFSTRTTGLTLVAPGEQIVSTLPGNAYQAWSGTSMATPHVTAATALMRAVNQQISPDAIKADLEQTARPLVAGGPNPESGFGLLQVGAAVAAAAGSTPVPVLSPVPSPSPVSSPVPSPVLSPVASPSPAPPDPGASPSPGPLDPGASPIPAAPDQGTNPSPVPSPPPIVAPAPVSPKVASTTPRSGTSSVARSTHPRITFTVPVSAVSTRTILLTDTTTGRRVTIRVAYSASSRTATITPVTRLAAYRGYRITVTTGVEAVTGGLRFRATFTSTFRTGAR